MPPPAEFCLYKGPFRPPPSPGRRKAAQFPGQAVGWLWARARPASAGCSPAHGAEMLWKADVVKHSLEALSEWHAD